MESMNDINNNNNNILNEVKRNIKRIEKFKLCSNFERFFALSMNFHNHDDVLLETNQTQRLSLTLLFNSNVLKYAEIY